MPDRSGTQHRKPKNPTTMIREYITYVQNVKGYSPLTVRAYYSDLRHFAAWARENMQDARWSKINREVVELYTMDAARNEQSPATTNRRLASLSGFYKYMKRKGYEVEDPTQYESRRKQAQTLPATIDVENLRAAYKKADGVVKFMLGILITTGMRISEMLALEWEDFNRANLTIKVRGKGSKERIVRTTEEIMKFYDLGNSVKKQSGRMFHYDDRAARYMIHEALKQTCHDKKLSPHIIRHTFATNLAAQGVNATTIQSILGHSHLETTQKYINLAATQAETAAQTHSII